MVSVTEFRIPLPFSLDEFERGFRYSNARSAREQGALGNGLGLEILSANTFYDEKLGEGTFQHAIYRMGDRLPSWAQRLAPPSAMMAEERTWNAFPWIKTVITCPFFSNVHITILTRNVEGETSHTIENIHALDEELLAQRRVEYLDIADFEIQSVDPKDIAGSNRDPRTFRSASGRGPLTQGWQERITPRMCSYKLCIVKAPYWGIESRAQRYFMQLVVDCFLVAHRNCYMWMDEWMKLSQDDVDADELRLSQDCRTPPSNHGSPRPPRYADPDNTSSSRASLPLGPLASPDGETTAEGGGGGEGEAASETRAAEQPPGAILESSPDEDGLDDDDVEEDHDPNSGESGSFMDALEEWETRTDELVQSPATSLRALWSGPAPPCAVCQVGDYGDRKVSVHPLTGTGVRFGALESPAASIGTDLRARISEVECVTCGEFFCREHWALFHITPRLSRHTRRAPSTELTVSVKPTRARASTFHYGSTAVPTVSPIAAVIASGSLPPPLPPSVGAASDSHATEALGKELVLLLSSLLRRHATTDAQTLHPTILGGDTWVCSWAVEAHHNCGGAIVILRAVQWDAVRQDKEWQTVANLVSALDRVRPSELGHSQRLAFWLNVYNGLVMHAHVSLGEPPGRRRRNALLRSAYNIGGMPFTICEIEHAVLRHHGRPPNVLATALLLCPKFKPTDPRFACVLQQNEPLVSFAISTGAATAPAVHVFSGDTVHAELQVQAHIYLERHVQVENKHVRIPKLLSWWARNFGRNWSEVLQTACALLAPEKRAAIQERIMRRRMKRTRVLRVTAFDWSPAHCLHQPSGLPSSRTHSRATTPDASPFPALDPRSRSARGSFDSILENPLTTTGHSV